MLNLRLATRYFCASCNNLYIRAVKLTESAIFGCTQLPDRDKYILLFGKLWFKFGTCVALILHRLLVPTHILPRHRSGKLTRKYGSSPVDFCDSPKLLRLPSAVFLGPFCFSVQKTLVLDQLSQKTLKVYKMNFN